MSVKKIIFIVLAALILIIGAVCCFLRVDKVSVTGNERYTKEEIEERIFPAETSRLSAVVFMKNLLGRKEEIPFVETYTVSFESPADVEVIVYEKSIVGCIRYMSSYMFFDKDGIVVESSSEGLPGIPEITGLDFGSIVLYQKLPISDDRMFTDILNLTQVLSINDIHPERIDFDNKKATLYIGDIKVYLGGNNEINGKISELRDMLPRLTGLKGTLYLDNYDPKTDNAAYTFVPE